jgi:UDP-N-acetyl-D-mannosaminuronate dehydrogenase
MNKTDNVLILGYGEIGKAIGQLCSEAGMNLFWKDLDKSNYNNEIIDVMHVCIPFTDYNSFEKILFEASRVYNPGLIIINSTVEIGTYDKLSDKISNLVYSPCRGVHPNLYEGLKTFVKYIGGNQPMLELAAIHFNDIKVETKFMKVRELEAAKLYSTLRYGMDIRFTFKTNEFCKENNLDFEDVYTEWTKTYNNGYKKMNKEKFLRPVLYPPKNGIGGHCVIENAEILYRQGFKEAKKVLEFRKDRK